MPDDFSSKKDTAAIPPTETGLDSKEIELFRVESRHWEREILSHEWRTFIDSHRGILIAQDGDSGSIAACTASAGSKSSSASSASSASAAGDGAADAGCADAGCADA